jgi:hypothetical protein
MFAHDSLDELPGPAGGTRFRWNHDTVMREGARGLARKLATNVYIF